MEWLTANIANIILSVILAAAFGSIIFYLIRSKIQGKPSCGSSCGGCGMADICHSPKKTADPHTSSRH